MGPSKTRPRPVQVVNSSFKNCSTTRAAGGAIAILISSGNGAIAVGSTVFSENLAAFGGAISIYDGNETNTASLYLEGNTFGQSSSGLVPLYCLRGRPSTCPLSAPPPCSL